MVSKFNWGHALFAHLSVVTTDEVIKLLANQLESTDQLSNEQKEKFLYNNASKLLGFSNK